MKQGKNFSEMFLSLKNWKQSHDFTKALSERDNELHVIGIADAGKAFFSCAAAAAASVSETEKTDKGIEKFLYIAQNDLAARKAYDDFNSMTGDAVLFEPYEYMLYDTFVKSTEIEFRRMDALRRIINGDFSVVVASVSAFMQYMVSPEHVTNNFFKVSAGMITEPQELADRLSAIGYERVLKVEEKGQFSVRGDITDVFPANENNPVRIEFFDNEIDTVRFFDVVTQRTIENTDEAEIFPKSEFCMEEFEEISVRKRIVDSLENKLIVLRDKKLDVIADKLEKRVFSDIEKLGKGKFPGMDRYIPFITERKHTLLDYLGDVTVIISEPEQIFQTIETVTDEHIRTCETINEVSGLLDDTVNMYMTADEFCREVKKGYNTVWLNAFGTDEKSKEKNQKYFSVSFTELGDFGGNIEQQGRELSEKYSRGYSIFMLAANKSRLARISAFAKERYHGINCNFSEGGLSSNFISHDLKIIVMGDNWFSNEKSGKKTRGKKVKALNFFAEVHTGDLVVHDVHGIGRFEGVEQIDIDGVKKDFIKIAYRDSGVLYVPTYQLGSVEKYIGPEGNAPKLNKLGGAEWSKIKSKVKASLRTYAKELAELYARRSKVKGFAFSEDTIWQKEFEDSFIHEETEDQIKCVEEIKADMEQPRPMERLLCGDVGFGKTEVALRAAFKAVCDGKQVAFLVPTTVLAMQHYRNFVERFKDFPVNVDYLCRLRTPKERKTVMDNVSSGKIDVLVGTHSILQKKIDFKNLGLLIIDEEQRFGVQHKDKLKASMPSVDILSLSATPIPRTLHMSLSGIRDISVLSEPPGERLPVQTYVTAWDPAIVKNAIYREMARKGQVFYLYNKVRTIEEKRYELERLVPEARIAIGHGQMSERELEDMISAFLRGEYDIMLCTTIIESGIDMPNVNTIIIEDGDKLGLAQLYQIRGRVGRSNKRAYAYVTYPQNKKLSETAEKRLHTIKDFTEFGSGFKIALRDLEIRGAGSVLGEQQHGQLAVVGYDAYCRLLSEVIIEEQGGDAPVETVVNIDIKLSAFIPSGYIPDENSRLEIYRKIALISSDDDVSELTDELADRYGDVPQDVVNLMTVAKIRANAEKCGFVSVIQQSDRIVFVPVKGVSLAKISAPFSDAEVAARYRRRFIVNTGTEPYIALKIDKKQSYAKTAEEYSKEILSEIENVLCVI